LSSEPTLSELKNKLSEEEELYIELLAKIDELSRIRAPYAQDETLPELLSSLNDAPALTPSEPPPGGGLMHRIARSLLRPELEALRAQLTMQQSFNRDLVQFLNRFAETTNRAAAAQAEFTSTLVGFAQRIDRLADAKDRLYASLGNTRADLLLEAMDKRLEHVSLGLRRLSERFSGVETSLTVARSELRGLEARASGTSAPETGTGAAFDPQTFEAEHYLAFEERFRGSSEELRERLRTYVSYFEGLAPVVDLGCGRGEFLELLRDAAIESKGIDANREMVHTCRDKNLEAEVSDLTSYLEHAASGSLGGLFAAQVIEHLPPPTLRTVLGECYRVLAPHGCVVLETVNPRSVAAFVAFYRDLTHQKPVHPETLEFLLRAVGFRDVTIRYGSPISERAKLLDVTSDTAFSDTLNQNFEKLNAFLFGDQDYAAIASK